MDIKICGHLLLKVATGKASGKRYYCIVCDVGYMQKYLTFNISDIAEICGLSTQELTNLDEGLYELVQE